jgi:predicted DCC family thiol-disulfide oxidoreductase YuxK
MRKIWVLYDSGCGLCSRARKWMLEQPALLDIEFVAAGSEHARRLFPTLRHEAIPSELVVIDDEGNVYRSDAAWIVCLYALAEFRTWSYRLASPPLRRFARRVWEASSTNRQQISRALALESDAEIATRLEAHHETACETAFHAEGLS